MDAEDVHVVRERSTHRVSQPDTAPDWAECVHLPAPYKAIDNQDRSEIRVINQQQKICLYITRCLHCKKKKLTRSESAKNIPFDLISFRGDMCG